MTFRHMHDEDCPKRYGAHTDACQCFEAPLMLKVALCLKVATAFIGSIFVVVLVIGALSTLH